MANPNPKKWHVSRIILSLLCLTYMANLAAAIACPSRCNSCVDGVVNCTQKSLTAPPKSYPANTKVINLRQNNIRTLGSRSFRRGQTAEVLKMERNKVTVIRNDAFRNFPHLVSLDLQGNRIFRLFPRAFAHMRRLRTLSLHRNRIRRVMPVHFQGVPNLHQLNLANNRISRIGENDLASLTLIHYLDIRDNSIQFIHKRAFKKLENLRYLFLNNNPLARALDLTFGTEVLQLVDMSNCQLPQVPQTFPASVTDLRLGNNKIMQINHTDFENITDLQMIALNNNELHFLADGTFSHLKELKEIWLRKNNLVFVPRDIPSNVQKIHIDSNRIQEIEARLFLNDSQLSFFSVENNQLSRINPDTFTGLNDLMTINLQGNQLQHLETGTFSNLVNLYTIMLSNNPLQRIESHVFQNLPNLTHLHIAYLTPETMEIGGNFLPAMPRVQTLMFMASPGMGRAFVDMISSASEEEFVIMPSVTSLDLSYNNLHWLTPRLRVIFPNVQAVILDGNAWHCSENMAWLQEWINTTEIKFYNYGEPKCETPASLKGREIRSLTPDEWRNGGVLGSRNQDRAAAIRRRRRKRRL